MFCPRIADVETRVSAIFSPWLQPLAVAGAMDDRYQRASLPLGLIRKEG